MSIYADDNTPYTFSSEVDATLKKRRSYTIKIFKCVHNNCLKPNAEKCNLIRSANSLVEIQLKIKVHIDGRLWFKTTWIKFVTQLAKKYTLYLGYVNIWIKINHECLWRLLWICNSLIALWYGCFTVETLKTESIKFIKEPWS